MRKWSMVVGIAALAGVACQSGEENVSKTEVVNATRFEGNRRMAAVLDSLSVVADFQTNYYLSGKRAAFMLQNKPDFKNIQEKVLWHTRYALECLNAGNAAESISVLEGLLREIPGTVLEKIRIPLLKPVFEAMAVSHLRQGEDDNCVANHNAESCILPLKGAAIHTKKNGSQQAMALYHMLLDVYPKDVQLRWLMNVAAMTLGEFPQGVPAAYRIDFTSVDTKISNFLPFSNAATDLGLDVKGLSGAGIIEDFNGDGFMDVFASSYGIKDPVNLFFSDGKGGFIDVTDSAQLTGITGGLNAKQADYNNDGFMDILILRGAWLDKGGEWPNSLLRNNGDGTFSDVTFESGMGKNFFPTETAAWADVNNDGWVDVFIANENNANNDHPCELYINNGDGTFTDKAKEWGMDGNFGYAKAANFADFNNDGWMDLFLGCLGQENYVFMNRGKQENGSIKFENIAAKAGLTKPLMSFPAIVADFDHNGFPDILTTSFPLDRLDFVAEDVGKEFLGIPNPSVEKTKLFLNYGNEIFKDVSKSWGIDKMIYAMGFNAGDLNNDGWIDFYAGTGAFAFTTLVPNRVFLNRQGLGFDEVTGSSGMAHLQKGHGIGFGDIDNDGDQDVYVTLGGAVEGDDAHNALFVNPNKVQNWVRLQLIGSANKNIIGARVKLSLKGGAGQSVERFYTVGDGGTFGSNSMELEIGLGDATSINQVEVQWPGRGISNYKTTTINKAWELHEEANKIKPRMLVANPLKGKAGSKACCK